MRLYSKGDSGEPIRDIQGRLSALGFDSDDPAGEFGPGTEHAVKEFQKTQGLDSDALVGQETWRALYEAGYDLGDRVLFYRRPLMRGDDVADLQRRLNELGFGAEKVDGMFGPLGHAALIDFQSNRGIVEDGIAGPTVVKELKGLTRVASVAGRERVKELEWLRTLPTTVVGARIYLDPAGYNKGAQDAVWSVAVDLAANFQKLGGSPLLSRSIDTYPTAHTRAARANRLGAQLALSFQLAGTQEAGVFFFASPYSRSEAGAFLAESVGKRIGLQQAGRASTILKETRAAALLIVADPRPGTVEGIVGGVCDFFATAAQQFT